MNISDAEGFGLATLESLACETPIIVNMTGGLQEQVDRLSKENTQLCPNWQKVGFMCKK